MSTIYTSATDLIGKTPLLLLCNYMKKHNLKADIIGKLEYLNPAGSVKDRAALSMIIDAENRGILKANSVIIEPTSGNTGIGLSFIGAVRGYKVILTMPDSMSAERRNLLKAYGAEIVLTDGSEGMAGAIKKANELARDIENAFIPSQFENPANSQIHKDTTGPEIWNDCDGNIDIFVAGIGTGGTITGVGEFLKSKNPNIKVVGVEPQASALLSGGKAASHRIQGIGANFIPTLLNRKIYDEIIAVSNEDAYSKTKELVSAQGILLGISSGAAIYAATILAKRKENEGKKIVVLLPDSGERYISTGVFE